MDSTENKKIVQKLKVTADIHEQALKAAREVTIAPEESIHDKALKAAREVTVAPEESIHDKALKAAREVTIKSLREKNYDNSSKKKIKIK